MKCCKGLLTMGVALVVSSLGTVHAQQAPTDAELLQEVRNLRAEVERLRGDQQGDWLNERRKEEVKALVHEVLQDADTRASLQGEGMTAGHDGKHFFLNSADGTFSMEISGQIQVRYIYNTRDDDTDFETFDPELGVDEFGTGPIDENEAGFQIRRTKLNFSGHVGSPKFTYEVQLAAERSGGDIFAEDVVVGYKIADGLKVEVGRQKLPFLREELVSSKRQLAVERSSVGEFFTLNRSEGIWVHWMPMEIVHVQAAISDGGNAAGSDFHTDRTEAPSITARIDVALAGNLAQGRDFTGWEGEPLSVIVGGAIHWEAGEVGDSDTFIDFDTDALVRGTNNPDQFAWTVDASVEMFPFNVYGAFIGSHAQDVEVIDFDTGELGEEDFDNYGALVQVGVHVIPNRLEPFFRFEWLDVDSQSSPDFEGSDDDDEAILLTFGANYYLNKHNAKLTVDVVWALDPLTIDSADGKGPFGARAASSGLGLLPDNGDEEDQIAIRAQFQLLF